MTHPTPGLSRLLVGLAAVFAVLVGLRVHGYSIAYWHALIDGSPAAEVRFGEPRGVRSDDWQVILPMALAQGAHEPRFPLVNRNVGLGHDMLLPDAVPVAHPVTLFRPSVWGFFVSDDVGLAWMWWSRALGLFAVWVALAALVTGGRLGPSGPKGGRLGLSVGTGVLVLASPFFQFWSLIPAPAAAYGGAAFLAATALATTRSRRGIALASLGLGAAGGCFALTLYPPFQVPLAWLFAALGAGLAWERRGEIAAAGRPGERALGAAAALGLAGAAVALLLVAAGDAVELMRNTAYPGERISTGGGRPPWALLSANLAIALQVVERWGPLKNVCEAASFFLVSPAIAGAIAWRWIARGARPDSVEVALLVYAAALFVYCGWGFPEWLARATGLSLSPGRRAVIGLGLADALLLARFLSREPVGRMAALVVGLVWAAALALVARHLAAAVPGFSLAAGAALAVANGAFVAAAVASRRRTLPLAIAATAVVASTAWFNPVTVGGADYLRDNPLSRKIVELDRAAGGESTWIAYGSPRVGNLFRVLGVRSISGVQPVPQFALWQTLDPDARFRERYNRYLHPAFFPWERADVDMRPVSVDILHVHLHPDAPALRELGVTHVLAHGDDARASVERLTDFARVYSLGDNHLYRAGPDASPRAGRP